MSRPVYLVDGARTPFLKARGKPGPFTPVDLAVQCGRPLLLRQDFDKALTATRDDPAKFARFAKATLGTRDTAGNRTLLRAALGRMIDWEGRVDELLGSYGMPDMPKK